MKRIIYIIAFVVALYSTATAQVEKQVEVTKNYVPTIARSTKLAVVPNMVDTVTMRPEIDYTITPRQFASPFGTRQFNPAKVTYWEYERRYPFYAKVGIGYPLNTVADVYATTERADVGYVMGYFNHRGEFSKVRLKNPITDGESIRNPRQQMINCIGVAGGKYYGRYTLSGDVFYRSDMYRRYTCMPVFDADADKYHSVSPKINFEDVNLKVRFGDSFSDLRKLNFEVYAATDFYNDKSARYVAENKFQQFNASAGARIARRLATRSMFSLAVDYAGHFGSKALSVYKDHMLSVTALYGYNSGRLLELRAGGTYWYDPQCAVQTTCTDGRVYNHHFTPILYAGLNVGGRGLFVPYIEMTGTVENNSFQSLLTRNPYIDVLDDLSKWGAVPYQTRALPNTVRTTARIGLSGHTANNKFAYRIYTDMTYNRHAIYWCCYDYAYFGVGTADRLAWSFVGELDYKPISQLYMSLRVKGTVEDDVTPLHSAVPPVEAKFHLRYKGRKVAFGTSAELYGTTKWSCIEPRTGQSGFQTRTMPASVDVGVDFDWFLSNACTLFVEGHNLANMPTYRWAYYREYGVNFTVGVKVQF